MNTFGTSLEFCGEYNNQFMRHQGPGKGWLFATFRRDDEDSIRRAAKYVGATDEEIEIILGKSPILESAAK